jgi:hypothetical protein
MKLKYSLHPGYVTSKKDGDRHFISATELAMCYGVSLAECLVVHWGVFPPDRSRLLELAGAMKLIPLHPRYNGDYIEYLTKLVQLAGDKP